MANVIAHNQNCDSDLLDRKPVLDSAECARAVETVLALKEHWIQRHESAPFYTLGTASYLDARSPAAYREQAARTNPPLRKHFGWLLERIASEIADETGLESHWLPQAALPGFHVFLSHWSFMLAPASVHFDMQHEFFDWSEIPGANLDDLLSFTLPVQLPESGGGLNIWDIDRRDLAGADPDAIASTARSRRPAFHPYNIGEVVMHSGHLLHQIARPTRMDPDDRRITLQGHGTKAGGHIYLYW